MASYTTNLNLLKKDPATDGSDTFNIATMLNDNWDKIDAAMAAAKSAAEYNPAATYAVDTYCNHDGKLYKCTSPITAAEVWNAAHWKETSVGAELAAAYAALAAHTGNTANPHGVTAAQVGAAAADHTHTAEQVGADPAGSADAVMQDLNQLYSNFLDEYSWSKSKTEPVYQLVRALNSSPIVIYSYNVSNFTFGRGLTVDASGNISLTGIFPVTTPATSTYASFWSSLCSSPLYAKAGTTVVQLTSYTESGSDYVQYVGHTYTASLVNVTTIYGYVHSLDSNEYPPEVSDGYDYTSLSRIGDKKRTASGSFVLPSAGQTVTVTLGFRPKFVFAQTAQAKSYFTDIQTLVCTNGDEAVGSVVLGVNSINYYHTYTPTDTGFTIKRTGSATDYLTTMYFFASE